MAGSKPFTVYITGSVFPGFSYAFKAANLAASLNALNAITDVNVISSPSLTVAANKTHLPTFTLRFGAGRTGATLA